LLLLKAHVSVFCCPPPFGFDVPCALALCSVDEQLDLRAWPSQALPCLPSSLSPFALAHREPLRGGLMLVTTLMLVNTLIVSSLCAQDGLAAPPCNTLIVSSLCAQDGPAQLSCNTLIVSSLCAQDGSAAPPFNTQIVLFLCAQDGSAPPRNM